MKGLIYFLLIVIIVMSSTSAKAQNEEVAKLEQKAFLAYINSNVSMWKQIALEADKILTNENENAENKIKAIEFKYGLLYACLSNKDEETFEKYLGQSLKQIELLLNENPNFSTLHAISAGIMGVQMGFSPMKGVTLGSLSGVHIEKSTSLDSLNAIAWRQYSSSKYFTPKMWGGDINEAISGYEHAIRLFENNNQTKDWKYIDSIVWLGIAYEKNGEKEKAQNTYEKALEVAPEFIWVKNYLLPNLLKS
ncbi:MAG: tetratricopeptide repeat protein [Bacteroidales bacterium]|jgi:tetratricopeptide (TPR) repeat protein|nr:tetratricopeptide repeat protein [Bacteroidales bacterium]